MEDLMISGSKASAKISPKGGTITGFQCEGGEIFYPQRKVGEKMRGGCPICAPWFGPSELGPQHGHLRGMTAEYQEKCEDATPEECAMKMSFCGFATEKYPWRLRYKISVGLAGRTLSVQFLMIRENDSILGYAPIAPGFHPYFAGNARKASVLIGKEEYGDFSERAKIVSLEGIGQIIVKTPDREVVIGLERGFGQDACAALWTDNAEEYFCVEPIVRYPGKLDEDGRHSLCRGQIFGTALSFSVI